MQQSDPAIFTERLGSVWAECYRVLRPEGLLVFTYHHSRTEGWRCILESLHRARFVVVATHPIKAEMSVATPKAQAKEPIDLDVILVCRKREAAASLTQTGTPAIDEAIQEAGEQVTRLNRSGRRLSRNDVRVVLMAQAVKRLSWVPTLDGAICYLDMSSQPIGTGIDEIHQRQPDVLVGHDASGHQLALW